MDIGNNHDVNIEDHGNGDDGIKITRYKGSKNIKEMIEEDKYIEAFTHCQMGVEKILLDKIAAIDSDKSASIEKKIKEEKFRTFELIKWSYLLGVITDDDYKKLRAFNKSRNKVIHGHGNWWNATDYKESLQKAVAFIETNGM